MRVCYSLLLLRITAFYSLRLLIKRTKEYTCEIIIELKREREVWLMTRRPLCAQNTQKDASKSIAKRETFLRLSVARGIKTEKTRRCRPPRERRECITAALFKRTV